MGEFDRLIDGQDGRDTVKTTCQPGDLIELAGSGSLSSRLAVYLRTINQQSQYYTIEGRLSFANYQNALSIVPGFVKPDALNAILEYAPIDYRTDIPVLVEIYREAVPRHIGAPISNKLAEFHAASEEAYRKYASTFDNAHKILAHPTQYTHMHLNDVASKLTGIPVSDLTAPLVFAVSNCLLRGEFGFRAQNRSYAYTRMLGIESQESTTAVHRVVRWVRAYQEQSALGAGGVEASGSIERDANVLQTFAIKARGLIERSRESRLSSPEGAVLANKPSFEDRAEPRKLAAFSSSDLDFIRFMTLLVSTKGFFFHPTLRSIPTVILRATGCYPDATLDIDIAHALLVEIGVMQPFQDPNAFDRDLVPRMPEVEAQVQAIQAKIDEGEDPKIVAGLKDSMHTIRKDWGDLSVFCIDATSAIDVDDGISLEKVPGEPNQHWLHVHVVHLSAFTGPDHVLAKSAQNREQAHYSAEGRVGMLPSWVASQFSLESGSPVMTVSTRLDENGNVLEKKVQAGYIRNVIKANYEAINAMLNFRSPENMMLTLAVGDADAPSIKPRDDPNFDHIEEKDQKTLKKLYQLSQRLNEARRKNAPVTSPVSGSVHVAGITTEEACFMMDRIPTQATFSTKQPSIAYHTNLNYDQDLLDADERYAPARIVVEEAMLQAGSSAAGWAANRKVPIPYWGTAQNIGGLEVETQMLRKMIRAMATGKEPFNRDLINYFRRQFTTRDLGADPIPHGPLGFSQYTKMTSPLRRYMDLVAQWQIDGALREEARRGASLVTLGPALDGGASVETSTSTSSAETTTMMTPSTSSNDSYLPMTRADITAAINHWLWRFAQFKSFEVSHLKHWKVQAMARAFYLKEYPLPETMTVVLGTTGGARRVARLEQLDLNCDTEDIVGESGDLAVEGDRWIVRIKAVKLHAKRIIVTLVEKIGSTRHSEVYGLPRRVPVLTSAQTIAVLTSARKLSEEPLQVPTRRVKATASDHSITIAPSPEGGKVTHSDELKRQKLDKARGRRNIIRRVDLNNGRRSIIHYLSDRGMTDNPGGKSVTNNLGDGQTRPREMVGPKSIRVVPLRVIERKSTKVKWQKTKKAAQAGESKGNVAQASTAEGAPATDGQ